MKYLFLLLLVQVSDGLDFLHEAPKLQFKVVEIRYEGASQFKLLKKVRSSGVELIGVSSPGDLARLDLKKGDVISGVLTVDTFASDGGLGTTQVEKAKLSGATLTNSQGQTRGCPPLCEKFYQLEVSLKY